MKGEQEKRRKNERSEHLEAQKNSGREVKENKIKK